MSQDGKPLSDHPDLGPAGAAMRAEWRADQEDAARDAAEAREHGLTLRDFALECGGAGVALAISLPGQRFAGNVLAVGRDFVGLQCVGGRVEIHTAGDVPMVWQKTDSLGPSGPAPESLDATFRSVLLGRETGDEVTVGTALAGEVFDGRLVVCADHIRVVGRGGGETVLPLRTVAYVMPRRP